MITPRPIFVSGCTTTPMPACGSIRSGPISTPGQMSVPRATIRRWMSLPSRPRRCRPTSRAATRSYLRIGGCQSGFAVILIPMPASGTALLIVDVQEASLDGCSEVPQVIDRINELLRRAGEASAPVIFIQHDGAEDGLARGTPGWELAAALERPGGAHLVEKSYRDAFADTELKPLLYRLGVKRLVVTGVHSDFCVQMTALSAVIRGFDLAFVSDAHATRDSA